MTAQTASVVDLAHDIHTLWMLATAFPHLPAAQFDIDPQDPCSRVNVHVHNDPGGFEQWREALDFAPDAAEMNKHSDFCAVHIRGTYAGTPMRLVGYLPLPAEDVADAD